ncbi:branched-chain amino acid ABC transporter substrate-binding protein [Rhizobium sp. R693]|uniref:branched-chain amino acid ABC transporter substrate-binding protein n=1 Tax=Rhizobium sp. R693 TaxID=1764276 RepID=UPI000B52BBD9|nr:branched-chain amino acid ABC transporter substrate-binding protein [Rhizobium sp. R693]OWV93608.1 branched chain amino acid ABC transporter substrate-binding protein [Rhizobium sp. R693]
MRKMLLSAIAAGAIVAFSSPAFADVLMGVAGPVTGPGAAFGAQLKRGAEKAAADINAAGGINGEKILLEIGDDASDPKQGISVANKFVADNIKFVVGHYNSGVSMPASEVYAENGILEISPSSTIPDFTERGLWNVFRTCGRDDQQGKVAGEYIAAHFKDGKVAIINDKSAFGQGMAAQVKKAMNAGGVTEVMYDAVNVGEKDFSALVSKMKDSGVTLIYYAGYYAEAGLISRQIADQGLKAVLMGGDDLATAEFAAVASDAAEGALFTFAPDPRKNPEAADIVKKFRDDGFEPEAYTLYSYAAVQIIAQAATAAKSLDPQSVAEAIHSKGPFKTVIGDISYDAKGDITRADYVVYRWMKSSDGTYNYEQVN